MIEKRPLSMVVNGKTVGPVDVPVGMPMIDFLQEYLNLTGTRLTCGQGVCRACTIIIDGEDGSSTVPACITGIAWLNGRTLRTIEGIAGKDTDGRPVPSPVQQAFLEHFAFQCSYCTPGFVNAATVLVEALEKAPIPVAEVEGRILDALDANLCRCTGYVRYYQAVREVVLNTPGLTVDGPAKTANATVKA